MVSLQMMAPDQFGENLSQRGNFVFDKEIAMFTFTDETRIRVTHLVLEL